MFAGGVRIRTPVVFLIYSSCSCLCHIYSWFLSMSWVLSLSILLSVCRVYIYVRLNIYYVELPVILYLVSPLQCLVYHMLSK